MKMREDFRFGQMPAQISAALWGILDRLTDEKDRLPVEHLCTWVRGFGDIGPAG